MRKIDLAIDLRAQNDFADLTSGQDLTFRVHHGLELDLVLEMVGLICPIMTRTRWFISTRGALF